MTLDLWITPEETPALAAQATALIDARLSRFAEAERAAFWSSIRKAYNTPYNDPSPREVETPRKPQPPAPVEIEVPDLPLPVAALAAIALPPAGLVGDVHAA